METTNHFMNVISHTFCGMSLDLDFLLCLLKRFWNTSIVKEEDTQDYDINIERVYIRFAYSSLLGNLKVYK